MQRRNAIMVAQFRKATSEPSEFVKYAMDEDKPWVWYAILSGFDGDDDEFKGGEYIVRIEAGAEFPFKPPKFYFHTPNGVYDVLKEVCISIGQYHPDQYRAALGMAGFTNQLVSGMIGWRSLGGGINIVHTTADAKKQLAADSALSNRRDHAAVIDMVHNAYIDYSAKWDIGKIPQPMRVKLGFEGGKEEV